MPRIADANMESHTIGGSNFSFTGARLSDLGASEYTLATIVVDVTGSTSRFADELRTTLIAAVDACRKSPRSANLLIRVVLFSSSIGVQEVHGFKPLSDIDTNTYPQFTPRGGTNLYDAAFSAIGSEVQYGENLIANDFNANGIVFIITDGDDNDSKATPRMIADKVAEARQQEKLESLITILIGINAAQCEAELKAFHKDAKLDQIIFVDDVNPQKLAKLAAFVSQSVSSQSQAMGTGGPSQNISATI